jgi:hypothetical protein
MNYPQHYAVEDYTTRAGWNAAADPNVNVNAGGQPPTVEAFWQDMMWDTFPQDMPDNPAGFGEGIDSVDWWQQVDSSAGNVHQWSHWSQDGNN